MCIVSNGTFDKLSGESNDDDALLERTSPNGRELIYSTALRDMTLTAAFATGGIPTWFSGRDQQGGKRIDFVAATSGARMRATVLLDEEVFCSDEVPRVCRDPLVDRSGTILLEDLFHLLLNRLFVDGCVFCFDSLCPVACRSSTHDDPL